MEYVYFYIIVGAFIILSLLWKSNTVKGNTIIDETFDELGKNHPSDAEYFMKHKNTIVILGIFTAGAFWPIFLSRSLYKIVTGK